MLAHERAAFAIDEAQMTAHMLADWRFPAPFVAAAHSHLDASAADFAPGDRVARSVRVLDAATAIARCCLALPTQQPVLRASLEAAQRRSTSMR